MVPQELSWDWINSFESCKCSLITKRNKEYGSLKKWNTGNIRGFQGSSPGMIDASDLMTSTSMKIVPNRANYRDLAKLHFGIDGLT